MNMENKKYYFIYAQIIYLLLIHPLYSHNNKTDPFPIEEIKKGIQGYMLTDLGNGIEKIELEVLGVINTPRAISSKRVLVKLKGDKYSHIGIAAGMSGSPVYIGDKLLGALSFTFPFSKEPIGGVTPADEMKNQPSPFNTQTVSTKVSLEDIIKPSLDKIDLSIPTFSSNVPLAWYAINIPHTVTERIKLPINTFASKVITTNSERKFKPGAPISIVLIDGDITLGATGTVTWVERNKIYAFGHPLFGLGKLTLPAAHSEIVTVVPSQNFSFKIANIGPRKGALIYDGENAVVIDSSKTASMLPMKVSIDGESSNFQLANFPLLVPTLSAISLMSSLFSKNVGLAEGGVDIVLTLKTKRWGKIELRNSFDGVSPSLQAVAYTLVVSDFLANNDLAKITLESIEVDIKTYPKPRTITVIEAYPEKSTVFQGEKLRIFIKGKEFRGENKQYEINFPIPETLKEGKFIIAVGDGTSVDLLKIGLQKQQFFKFEKLLKTLRELHSPKEIAALGMVFENSIHLNGETLPLPPYSINTIWRGNSLFKNSSPISILTTTSKKMDIPFSGLVIVEVNVKNENNVNKGEIKTTNEKKDT